MVQVAITEIPCSQLNLNHIVICSFQTLCLCKNIGQTRIRDALLALFFVVREDADILQSLQIMSGMGTHKRGRSAIGILEEFLRKVDDVARGGAQRESRSVPCPTALRTALKPSQDAGIDAGLNIHQVRLAAYRKVILGGRNQHGVVGEDQVVT